MNLHEAVCCLRSKGANPNALQGGAPPLAFAPGGGGIGFTFEDSSRAIIWALLKPAPTRSSRT